MLLKTTRFELRIHTLLLLPVVMALVALFVR